MLPAAARQGRRRAGWPLLSSARQASTLLYAEHHGDEGRIAPATLSAAAAAAAHLPGPLEALVVGSGAPLQRAAQAMAAVAGVTKVWTASSPALEHPMAEPHAKLLALLAGRLRATHLLAASSAGGRNVLPRAAALLGTQPVTDVVRILDDDTFVRPIYAGNAFATVKFRTSPAVRVLTVRPTAFPLTAAAAASSAAASPAAGPAAAAAAAPVPVEPVPPELLSEAEGAAAAGARWEGAELRATGRPELGSARVVVCGGRALKSAENFKLLLERLADLLGGAVGASRAAVDEGFVPNDLQVGQTGKVVAPELYIGVGISGAIQHLAGMKDSRTIVAINTDGEAPIFDVADYGLEADLFTAVPQLIEELERAKAAEGK